MPGADRATPKKSPGGPRCWRAGMRRGVQGRGALRALAPSASINNPRAAPYRPGAGQANFLRNEAATLRPMGDPYVVVRMSVTATYGADTRRCPQKRWFFGVGERLDLDNGRYGGRSPPRGERSRNAWVFMDVLASALAQCRKRWVGPPCRASELTNDHGGGLNGEEERKGRPRRPVAPGT
jgi:hypothetical protein